MTDDAFPIDLEEARRFIVALAGADKALICWQVFDDIETRKDDGLADTKSMPLGVVSQWLVAKNRAGCGIFATVNATDGKGRKNENVTGLRALFIDVDDGRTLPESWALPPSIIVQRDATHWHVYWLLIDGEPLPGFIPAMVQLAGHWQSDLKVCDLPRVMRVPGFAHLKAGFADAKAVRLVLADAQRRYTIAQVLAAHPAPRWETLPEKYQRKAAAAGIWRPAAAVPAAKASAPPRPPSQPRQDDEAWHVEQFVKWAAAKETTEGSDNPNGGRDAAAFAIACEGHGRHLPRDIIEDVVLDYLTRANFPDPQGNMRRIVGSACSRQRQAHAPVRRAPPGQAAPDGGARPPAPPREPPPPAGDGGGGEQGDDARAEAYGGLDVRKLAQTWRIDSRGVCPIEFDAKALEFRVRPNKRIAALPIWPEQPGRDVATGRAWWRIAWITPSGAVRRQWIGEDSMRVGYDLVLLPDAPVVKRCCEAAAQWLTEARSAVVAPEVDVVSRIGWCGINGSRRWVWPGIGADRAVQFVGDALPSHGDLDGWKAGLAHVAELGQGGYTALAVAALSAAAPFARLLNGQRNPVLGLQARSSSGKGSVLDWALALWCDPSVLRLPASSTAKGVQDRAIQFPDLPVFLDELQQLVEQDPRVASDALYFLANGQRRVTSSKAQVSVGGESRHGVGFYAAEAPVLPGLNVGVHMRIIELTGEPCPSEATARILRQAGQHTGVLAAAIADLIQSQPTPDWVALLRKRAAELKALFDTLQAGDSDVLALLEQGCLILERTCHIELPVDDLLAWLAQQVAGQRATAIDREALCLQQVLEIVLGLPWVQLSETGSSLLRKRVMMIQQRPVAFRDWAGEVTEHLDIVPSHPSLAPVFAAYGGDQRVLRVWADRGLIVRGEGRNLRFRRGDGPRVVRFSPELLKQEGIANPPQEVPAEPPF